MARVGPFRLSLSIVFGHRFNQQERRETATLSRWRRVTHVSIRGMRNIDRILRLLPWLISFCCFSVCGESRLEVQVEPRNDTLKNNIEAYIGDIASRDESTLQNYRRTAQTQAEKAVQALGYYQAVITTDVTSGPPPVLRIHVIPHSPVRLRNVNIQVLGEASEQKTFRQPQSDSLKRGAVLNHGVYEDAKRLIQNQASRYGYFDGRFDEHRLTVDPEGNWADIDLVFQSGSRYNMGKVTFEGEHPFNERLLRRMVPFKAGEPYDSELLSQLNNNLQASGYFESVRVDAAPNQAQVDGARKALPVRAALKMRKPRSMAAGVGVSTDVGPRVRFNWTRHWLNAEGHSFGYESEIAAPKQNIGAWYEIPLDPPMTDKFRFTAGYQYEELEDTESKLITLGGEWRKQLPSGWLRIVSLNWLREEYELGDDSGLSSFLMPGVNYSILRSDSNIDPSHGYRLQFDGRVAKQDILADADLVYVSALAKGLTTFWRKHRLLGRIQVGGIGTNDYKSIPPSLRFFAGGDQSVRGYGYQALSPKNSRDDKVGGRYMVAGSIEYQYSIAERWRLAAFIDEGNAFNSFSSPDLKTGVGFGVRWISPVGPLRVDLAKGLDEYGGFRVHFSMGPEL